MKVLIDNGHGVATPGKRSPDGSLREYTYAREIANRVVSKLHSAGVDAVRIVPEETDISLAERVARANKMYVESGKQAILVSIHCNAMGSGAEWMPANGWSVFVGGNASRNSQTLAQRVAEVAIGKKIKVRQPSPQALYWTADLYLCRKTNCPTILVENFFSGQPRGCEFSTLGSWQAVRDRYNGRRGFKLPKRLLKNPPKWICNPPQILYKYYNQ